MSHSTPTSKQQETKEKSIQCSLPVSIATSASVSILLQTGIAKYIILFLTLSSLSTAAGLSIQDTIGSVNRVEYIRITVEASAMEASSKYSSAPAEAKPNNYIPFTSSTLRHARNSMRKVR